MNPDTNRLEELREINETDPGRVRKLAQLTRKISDLQSELVRPDGTPVPKHWATFQMGELVEIKGYTFKVAYVGETSILFEPVGAIVPADEG